MRPPGPRAPLAGRPAPSSVYRLRRAPPSLACTGGCSTRAPKLPTCPPIAPASYIGVSKVLQQLGVLKKGKYKTAGSSVGVLAQSVRRS